MGELPPLLAVILLALIPAGGNFLGGVAAEVLPPSKEGLSLALHAAAGVVIGVVAIEIAPRAIAVEPGWLMVLAFIGGGLFFLAADAAIGIVRRRRGEDGDVGAGPWLIYFAAATDLFSDGIMIGAGATLSAGLALVLALGQVAADVPEGFATIATLRKHGVTRGRRLSLIAAFAVPVVVGAAIGWLGVRGAPESVKVGLLTFTAGVLTTVTIEEIVPEAHEDEDSRWATLAFILGFAGFMFLSRYVG